MKKKFLYSALFLMGMAFTGFTATSCNDDEDGGNGGNEFDEAANLNYTPEVPNFYVHCLFSEY